MPKILFVAEAVTLAHVARPLVLERMMREAGCETLFACDSRYGRFVDPAVPRLSLGTVPAERFLAALSAGRPVYRYDDLRCYVEDDLRLLADTRPDLVVGDFRLSLSISARVAGVPYAAVTNAYWSPHVAEPRVPMPVLPLSRWLPLMAAQPLFDMFAPRVMASHCEPFDRLRREHGLPALCDLRRAYTDADLTLYADVPSMFRMRALPAGHRFVGPLLWSPPVPRPDWWSALPRDRPVAYVTLGSSGQGRLLRGVVEALESMQVGVIAATAGASWSIRTGPQTHVADYLPGMDACAMADLVVCNGGSPTSQQALASGVPVLGIADNMDQFLNMHAVVERGAGSLLRADRCTPNAVRRAVRALVESASARSAARAIADEMGAYSKEADVVGALLGAAGGA